MRGWALAAKVAGVVFGVAYPFVVYLVLDHYGPRALALVLIVSLGTGWIARAIQQGWRRALSGAGLVTGLVLLLVFASLALREVGLTLLAPVVINAGLGVTFGSTLWAERPLIERFARLQHDDLSPAEVTWCRSWTVAWTGFFAFNVVLVSALAFAAPIEWWVLYTGGLAYAIMGALFAGEYVVRKLRFGRFDDHVLDRGLARLLRAEGRR